MSIIKMYDHCWIPDSNNEQSLSGYLGKIQNNDKFEHIGPISRLYNIESLNKGNTHFLAVLSGPEPQRSLFERTLIHQAEKSRIHIRIVRGIPSENGLQPTWKKHGFVSLINNLTAGDILKEMQETDYIICRSGYSSVMDLVSIKKRAILVPTPGQPEQEYLASYLSQKGWFIKTNQNEIDLKSGRESLSRITGFPDQDFKSFISHLEKVIK